MWNTGMLPALNLPLSGANAACADDSIEVKRFKHPDTHQVTWVCPSDNENCDAAYSTDRIGRNYKSVTLCVSPRPNLLSLLHDRELITKHLDEYEREVLVTGALETEVIAACQKFADLKPKQLFFSDMLSCMLLPSSANEYDAVASIEVVAKEATSYIAIGGERIESESRNADMLIGSIVEMKGGSDAGDPVTIEVIADEDPMVTFKMMQKHLYVKLTNYSGSIYLRGELMHIARNQLSLQPASQDPRSLKLMAKFPDYDPSKVVVRNDDFNGGDEAIITFMLWLAKKSGFEGYTHDGCLDLALYSGREPKLLVPEIFLMGEQAKQVVDKWIKTHGDFADSYEVPYKTMPTRPNMTTPKEYNARGKSNPTPLLQTMFDSYPNPHLIAWVKAMKLLKAAKEDKERHGFLGCLSGVCMAKNGKTDTSSGMGDLASVVVRQLKPRDFDLLQVVVVHPDDDGTSAQRVHQDDYFIRYFSFDDKIWNGEHGWIHDGILDEETVGPAGPDVKHMLVNLRVSHCKYFPDEEPFSAPVDWDEKDEGDAYAWANFVQSAYGRKDAENRNVNTVCSTVTHVLTVINITRSMEPMT